MPQPTKPNALISELSPYLQQHATNPVDWLPWGEMAFAQARKLNKPILLSIGYAACHWCHVMAHESFEDEETAALMNQLFINIKVDKEERPDLDKIYQTAHYLLTQQSGGWPLTIFLTPDRVPFFSGTYFPLQAYHQLPSFKQVLQSIAEVYKNRSAEIDQQGIEVKQVLQQTTHANTNNQLSLEPLKHAFTHLEHQFDKTNGGFGAAPKFPQASKLEFLLHYNPTFALETLEHMAKGGIYDQLEGGFYRYSVDERWIIPHFEKMLYDNGQLLTLYGLALQQQKNPLFSTVIKQTASWVINYMQAPDGGYYTSLDADSEGIEGKFYRWKQSEVRALLDKSEYACLSLHYGLNELPNFDAYWHFYQTKSLEQVAHLLSISLAEATQLLLSAKQKLLNHRQQRIAPFLDQKILTSWNALMIKGMLVAGTVLNDDRFLQSAHQAIQFIQQHAWHGKQLLACHMDGKSYLSAYLDDYAFLLDALLTALQTSWSSKLLSFTIELAEIVLANFIDADHGGCFFTAKGDEELLYRPKIMMDEAIPAGNGVFARSLLILGYLLAEPRYLLAAENILKTAWSSLSQYPAEHCSLLLALKIQLDPPQIIIIRAEKKDLRAWQNVVKTSKNFVFAIPHDERDLPSVLNIKKYLPGGCAYICENLHCKTTIRDKTILLRG